MTSASSLWPLPATAAMPDDLAGADLERDAAEGRAGRGRCRPRRRSTDRTTAPGLARRPLEHLEDGAADHQPGEVGRAVAPAGSMPAAVTLPRAHDRDPVGDREDLAELVADEDDAAAGRGHRPQRAEQLVGLLRGEDGRRLVHDQDPRAAVEHLEDLDPLLLADRQLPDLGARVDAQPDLGGEVADLAPRSRRRSSRNRGWSRPSRTFSVTVMRRDEREVLVDHPEAVRRWRRAASGTSTGRAVDADLPVVGPVQPGEDVHQRALAGAVLAEQGVDLAARRSKSTWSLATTPGNA